LGGVVVDDNAQCKLIFGALKEDGVSVTVNKKLFTGWVSAVACIRGMAYRKGFGLAVEDSGNVIIITRIAKGVRGRPRKKGVE
jgi:hypothetical protein